MKGWKEFLGPILSVAPQWVELAQWREQCWCNDESNVEPMVVVRFAQWREQGWHNDEGKVVAVVRTPRRRMWVEFVGYLRFFERFPLRICSLHLLRLTALRVD